jgi:long-chain acyl-CoA synthetase
MKPESIGALFLERAKEYGDKTFLMAKRGGKYKKISWNETLDAVTNLALGLYALGAKRGDRIAILSPNRTEWVIFDLAMQCAGIIDVPIYATSSPDQVRYIIKNSGASFVISGGFEALQLLKSIKGDIKGVKKIITMDSEGDEGDYIVPMSGVIRIGRETKKRGEFEKGVAKIKGDDLATLIYTSGTTGDPKGVMLTHNNFLSNVEALTNEQDIRNTDTFLSILPLSHSFERTVGFYFPMFVGAKVAYAEGIDAFRKNVLEIKPTVMVVVPRILEKVYASIKSRVDEGSELKRWLFDIGTKKAKEVIETMMRGERPGFASKVLHRMADIFIFRGIRKALGGKIRYLASGGAPLQREIGIFFCGAGLMVLEGYGLTETGPVLTVNTPKHLKYGTVGMPLPGTEIKIADDGEILARGPQIMEGYYKLTEETKKSFTKDGLFKTGDIGMLSDDGFLIITDRKKDIIITAGGKSVAPQNIENTLMIDPFIEQAVVIGDRRKFISALVVPNFEELKKWAKGEGIDYDRKRELLKDERALEMMSKRIDEAQKFSARFEKVKKFTLLPDPFTEGKGEMTASMKIKRKVIEERYAKEIEAMYK